MKYIFFPGNSFSNKDWVNKFSNEFNIRDKIVLNYDHWNTGDKQIDFNKELEKIKLLNIQEEIIAVCKSAGCYLSYISYKNNYLNIKKFIFIGYPYQWLNNFNLDPTGLLENIDKNLLIIQKEKDPVIGYEELSTLLNENNIQGEIIKYSRKGESNDTHSYEDVEYLKGLIDEYISTR